MKELIQALIKAKSEIKNPTKGSRAEVRKKDSQHISYTYFYADLASIVNAITPALLANGLIVVQSITVDNDDVIVSTTLYHESGESLQIDKIKMPCNPNDAQSIGSAATYGRKYSLMALFCLAGEDDDGANAQRQHKPRNANQQTTPQSTQPKPTEEAPFPGFQQAARGLFDKHRIPPEERESLVASACQAVKMDPNNLENEARSNLAKVYKELERIMEARSAQPNPQPEKESPKKANDHPLFNAKDKPNVSQELPRHDPNLAPPGTLSPEYEEIRGQLRVILNRSGHWDSEQQFLEDINRVCQEELNTPFDHIKRTHDKALIMRLYQRMAEIGGIEEPADDEEVVV